MNASIEWFRYMWKAQASKFRTARYYSGDQMLELMMWEEYWIAKKRKNRRR